ncbi:UNVERIFIED_CONTAM: hypothetical protein Slati_3975400 [Sesamum latifolium]|uniref:Uncharacterized protein n=1 Tax=Sesamum latifolium TaxID=2727402 RepID=A0AAW2TNU3_9LAMI
MASPTPRADLDDGNTVVQNFGMGDGSWGGDGVAPLCGKWRRRRLPLLVAVADWAR